MVVRLTPEPDGFNQSQAYLGFAAYHQSTPFMRFLQPLRILKPARRSLPAVILAMVAVSGSGALMAQSQQNIGELFASDASVKGGIVMAGSGTKVMSGSSIAAGEQAATLKLERGGSMLICPGTSLAVTSSQREVTRNHDHPRNAEGRHMRTITGFELIGRSGIGGDGGRFLPGKTERSGDFCRRPG